MTSPRVRGKPSLRIPERAGTSFQKVISLTLKRIPFKVREVPLHEVQQTLPREGIPPIQQETGRVSFYIVPAIHNLSTGVKLGDSWEIVIYLDTTYPDTHRLFPVGTVALQRAFTDSFRRSIDAGYLFFLPYLRDIIILESGPYFMASVERAIGKQAGGLVLC